MAGTPRIFISHSHKDNDFCLELITDLRRDLGSDDVVWYDKSGGLYGGDAWWRTIVREITAREVFMVILSPDAVASKWVEDEFDLAWRQKNEPRGKTIIPILYRQCDVRADLHLLHIISFLPPRPYQAAYSELLDALGIKVGLPRLRTDGVYLRRLVEDREYAGLRFYADGQVASNYVNDSGQTEKDVATKLAELLVPGEKQPQLGLLGRETLVSKYTVRGAHIHFSWGGGADCDGILQSGDRLDLEWRLASGQTGHGSYTFVPVRFRR